MLRAVLLAAALLALSACGGETNDADSSPSASTSVDSTPTDTAPSGAETYRSPQELVDALADQGVDCAQLQSTTSMYAAAQARCYVDGQETVIQLWLTAGDRDARVTEQVGLLGGAGIDYCYVLGVGETGTWSVNAGSQENCSQITGALAGDQLSS